MPRLGSKGADMRPRLALLPLLLLWLAACGSPAARDSDGATQASPDFATATELCQALATPAPAIVLEAGAHLPAVRSIYGTRDCTPFWHAERAPSTARSALAGRVASIAALDPAARSIAAQIAGAGHSWTDAELLATIAFTRLAVDPEAPASLPSPARLGELATKAAADAQLLSAILPVDPQIRRLRATIEAHELVAQAGGWPRIAEGARLQAGDRDPRVAQLRARLLASGDLAAIASEESHFDPALESALRRFQQRHGLAVDGKLGPATLAALNVPVARRLAILRENLARRMQQQRDWGPRYIAVNIAAAELTLVEGDEIAVTRRVIVGRPTWQTPELDSVIERLDLNPAWVVPASIARAEIMPKVHRDPGYLKRNGMRIVDGQIRQAPGPLNPLGQVKFVFKNSYSVYLHDTNAKNLFARDVRFLSHGCVRVEQALELARRLLAGDPDWPADRIDAALAAGRTIPVELRQPIPVHLVYDTAWVATDGAVNFREDAYGLSSSAALRTSAAIRRESACGI